jgi:hypothetical protein
LNTKRKRNPGAYLALMVPEEPVDTPEDAPPHLTANMGRGRLLFVPDVEELLRGLYTPQWIIRFFAPGTKHKVGRRPCWWERDALRWIHAQTDGRD